QANGDMYFQSLTQSTSAFRILDSLANPILTINTKPSTASCIIDFDNQSGAACSGVPFGNTVGQFTPFDLVSVSTPTTISAYTYTTQPNYNHTNSESLTGTSIK